MKRMVSLAAGMAVGYVLGSRAGREKYEQIAAAARRYAGQLPIGEPAGDSAATGGTSGTAEAATSTSGTGTSGTSGSGMSMSTSGTGTSGTGTSTAKTAATPKRPRPSSARGRSATAVEDREELRVAAKERIEDMPGETALGNPDPAAGGHGDPKTYEGDQLA